MALEIYLCQIWLNQYKIMTVHSVLQEFVSTVERLFPYITLVLTETNWPPQIPAEVTGLSQRVALRLNPALLRRGRDELHSLNGLMDGYDLIVEGDTESHAEALTEIKGLVSQRAVRTNKNLYVMSDRSWGQNHPTQVSRIPVSLMFTGRYDKDFRFNSETKYVWSVVYLLILTGSSQSKSVVNKPLFTSCAELCVVLITASKHFHEPTFVTHLQILL